MVGRHVAVKTETLTKRKCSKLKKKQTRGVSALLWKPCSKWGEGKFMDTILSSERDVSSACMMGRDPSFRLSL